ncbi:LOW QUALITY PROTEIN: peptidyl-prolyl cis-trans isomerase FKBP16-1, chloroplastic [Primulina huaijiensis]|uniref:LOW QUALITY PROTEIN: peptidyl-prolyl cis-trans isomerase FKBP16-1, chloroplastic n=1 Tax=Primulina huaijiensis TaxID=1492673 RepID=UPI003CC72481
MEAPALQFRIQFLKLSAFASIRRIQEFKVAAQKNLKGGSPALAAQKLPRRAILPLLGVNMISANVCTVFAAPVKEMKEPEILRILKFASGVRMQDIVEGQGQEASEGDLVEFNYVCRRSNGYFVHSSVDQFSGESSPVILPLDDKQIIKGLKEVLIGMKVGGKRRASIPPSAGYVSETLQPIPKEFGPRRSLLSHIKEPLVFEVQLLKVL